MPSAGITTRVATTLPGVADGPVDGLGLPNGGNVRSELGLGLSVTNAGRSDADGVASTGAVYDSRPAATRDTPIAASSAGSSRCWNRSRRVPMGPSS